MTSISAIVLPPRDPSLDRKIVGGLPLVERAVLALHRAGIDHIVVSGERLDDPGLAGRLARKDLGITIAHRDVLHALPAGNGAILVSADVVFEPTAIIRLVASGDSDATRGRCAKDALGATLVYLPSTVLDGLRRYESLRRGLFDLYRTGKLVLTDIEQPFCRPLPIDGAVWRLEGDYIRKRNGAEAVWTRIIRVFSVPVSQVLLRLRVSAHQVTVIGLVLSFLAAVQFTHRAFWPGVIGALFYYASMVLDCSDGEVARASFTDSTFGAWLETVSDYLSYFFVLGGLVVGELWSYGFCRHVEAAIVAAIASLCIVLIVGWLRHTVAGANPAAFDDAVVASLGRGTPLERFAVVTRSLIKRSFLAHLIVFMALIGHLPALLHVWAYGSVAALMTLLAVKPSLVQRVRVEAIPRNREQ